MKTKTKNMAMFSFAIIAGLIWAGTIAMSPKADKPKGYWIVNSDIMNEAGHKAYIAANRAIFAKYEAKFLVRWGRKDIVEGTASRSKQVIIEFNSYEDAVACYHSKEYEAAHKLRMDGIAITDMVIVEGFQGALPNH
jgi:uncharacterized protein (DUF1330 family)